MGHLLTNIEPVELWDHFFRLTRIPRPSGNEERVCRYIYDLARDLSMEVSMDNAGGSGFGNIIVKCPASRGYEKAPIVIVQSHVDMVALPEERKNSPLELLLDGTVLRAKGTTLGADNGIAVAMALSLMTTPELIHGPLELLFTINEEAGMTGVIALPAHVLQGRFLINIDSMEEGTLTVCSAGACHSVLELPLLMEPVPKGFVAVRLGIFGGKGGHSGLDINAGRANVGQLLARLLYEESKEIDLRLKDLFWGTVNNAIPSEASGIILVKGEHLDGLKDALSRWENVFREEYGRFEGPLRVEARERLPLPDHAMSETATRQTLSFLLSLPHGVHRMSAEFRGVVETSSNVATVRTSGGMLTVTVSQRSFTDPSLDAIITQCEAVANLAGAKSTHIGRSYGWKPDMDSRLLAVCRDAFGQVYGREPTVTGIHGMLECGLIKAKYPHMDMISIGPTILDAHAPTKADFVPGVDSDSRGERVDTARMARFWEFVKAVLKELATLPG